MRTTTMWLFATLFGCILAGAIVVPGPAPSSSAAMAAAQVQVPADHWRFNDGRWSFWNSGDRRWYYTDGTNWYYYENDGWRPYRFDRTFGREGFERGDYRMPAEGTRTELPRHRVYVAPR